MINLFLINTPEKGMGAHEWIARADEDKDFRCWRCFKELNVGFMCENDKKIVLCQDCQDNWDMRKCKHDKAGEHRHIKFIRDDETNI